MKRINAYEVKSDYYTIYNVTEEDLLDNIDKYKFNSILFDPKLKIEEGILEFTDEERPLSIGYDYVYKNYLGINSIYYEKNKEKIDDVLLEISKGIKTIYLYVDKEFINDKLRKSLISNEEIKELVIDSEKIR
jgi:hypothetical protein